MVYLIGQTGQLAAFCKRLGRKNSRTQSAFLIGGGITAWPQLLAELQASLARLVAERDGPILPEVRLCVHRNDANLLGAVYNCKETFGL